MKYNYSEPTSHSVFLLGQIQTTVTKSESPWLPSLIQLQDPAEEVSTNDELTTTQILTHCILSPLRLCHRVQSGSHTFKKYTAKNWDISQLSNTCKIHTKPWVQSPSTENKDLKNPIECLLIKDLSGSLQRESLSL